MRPPRYGAQPVKQVIEDQCRSIPRIAEKLGIPLSHIKNSVNGYTRPSQKLRAELPQLLGVPLEQLFSENVLAEPYGAGRPGGGRGRLL